MRIVPAAGWQRVRLDRARGTTAHSRRGRDRPRRDRQGARGRPLRAPRARRDRRERARQPGRRHRAGGPGARGRLADPRHRRPPQRRDVPRARRSRWPTGGLATSSTTVRRWRTGEAELHHIVNPAQRCARRRGVADGQRGRSARASRPTRPAPPRSCAARAPWPGSSWRASPPGWCAATARRRTPAAGQPRRRREPRAHLGPGLVPHARERRRLPAPPDRCQRARRRDREPLAPGARAALRHAGPAPQHRADGRRLPDGARAHGDHRSPGVGARRGCASCRCRPTATRSGSGWARSRSTS